MTTFTDDSGAEWEEDESWRDHIAQTYKVIRPVKKPKWQVSKPRLFPAATSKDVDSYVINIGAEVSEDQAQLIKEWISQSLEIFSDPLTLDHFDAGAENSLLAVALPVAQALSQETK